MPLALLGIFAAYLLINAGLHNEHPFADIVTAFGGTAPPVPGRSLATGTVQAGANPAGVNTPSETGAPAVATKGTKAVDKIIGFVKRIPGIGKHVHVGTICGPGSVAGSQHPMCNAVDLTTDTHAQLVTLFHTVLTAAKVGAIPASEVIGPGGPAGGKGLIATAARGWSLRPYTGPNSHQGHVHVSGSPLL